MDIKVLIAEEHGLEQWNPTLKAGFPLRRRNDHRQVFPSLQLDAPLLAKPEYTLR